MAPIDAIVVVRVDPAVTLSSLSPGRYDLQVSVLEPTGRKVNFWRSPVVLVR